MFSGTDSAARFDRKRAVLRAGSCGDLNRYTLTGCLPQRAPTAATLLSGRRQLRGRDPQQELKEAGITLPQHAAAPNAG